MRRQLTNAFYVVLYYVSKYFVLKGKSNDIFLGILWLLLLERFYRAEYKTLQKEQNMFIINNI